jgi:hypothetical protein
MQTKGKGSVVWLLIRLAMKIRHCLALYHRLVVVTPQHYVSPSPMSIEITSM